MQRTTDKQTTYQDGSPVDYFTKIPNELINHPGLTASQKIVLIKHHSEAFKTKTKPDSERKAAKRLGIARNTYTAATLDLVQLGLLEPHGKGGPRKQEAYTVHLERLRSIPARPSSGSNEVPVETRESRQSGSNMSQASGSKEVPDLPELAQIRATQKNRRRTTKEDGSTAPARSSLRDAEATSGEDGLGHSAGSAASPVSAAPSDIKVGASPGVHGIGAAEPATPPGCNGRNTLQSRDIADEMLDEAFGEPAPERRYTKREINDLFLTPEGLRVNSDAYELEYDLSNVYLPMVCGEPLNRGAFDKLVAEQGVEFCRLWMHWLSRKIADRYRLGKPVDKPTALYIKAVRENWEVDPVWPQFDEELHTVAARAEARRRQEARGPKAPVPGTSYTQDDVNRFADEVRNGERNLIYLPMQLQGPVRTRLDELHDAAVEADEIPF